MDSDLLQIPGMLRLSGPVIPTAPKLKMSGYLLKRRIPATPERHHRCIELTNHLTHCSMHLHKWDQRWFELLQDRTLRYAETQVRSLGLESGAKRSSLVLSGPTQVTNFHPERGDCNSMRLAKSECGMVCPFSNPAPGNRGPRARKDHE